jgi:hypothetical protein
VSLPIDSTAGREFAKTNHLIAKTLADAQCLHR